VFTDDLFADLDAMAAEYGWERLGQPLTHLRRYGKAVTVDGDVLQVTVSAYANRTGTAIVRAARGVVGTPGRQLGVTLEAAFRGKRDQVMRWLRWAGEDRRS
jgi:hypothetical protein